MSLYDVLPSDFSKEAITGLNVETLRIGTWQTRSIVTNNTTGEEFLVTEYHDVEDVNSSCFGVAQIGFSPETPNTTVIETPGILLEPNILQRITLTAIREFEKI